MRVLVLVLAVMLAFSSCTDEFDLFNEDIQLNESSADATILYANISAQKDVHFIRVHKGFVGGDFFEMAGDASNLQYAPGELTVEFHVLENEEVRKTYLCSDTLIAKEEGEIFSNDSVLAYYFKDSTLLCNENTKYKILVTLPGGETLYAVTRPVTDCRVVSYETVGNRIEFIGNGYLSVDVLEGVYGQVYKLDARLGYFEVGFNEDTTYHKITVPLDFETTADFPQSTIGRTTVKLGYYVNAVMDKLEAHFQNQTHDNIRIRRLSSLEYEAFVGNYDMKYVMEQGGTQSGFQVDILEFGNVTGGYGYFTAYYYTITPPALFTTSTHSFLSDELWMYKF